MCSPTGKDPEVLTARKYFASASFHDTGGRSASTLTLALVFIELNPKTFLRVVNLLQGGHGNRELAITKSADSDCGSGSEPLDHSKMTFFPLVGHTRRTSQNSCAWVGDASGSTGFEQSTSSFNTWLTRVLTG